MNNLTLTYGNKKWYNFDGILKNYIYIQTSYYAN